MSWETACDLSIPDLLRALNEKLGLEYIRLQKTSHPRTVSAAFLESEIESLETKARDVLRLIPSLRNTLQPVNRLPPEILSRVARHVLEWHYHDARLIFPLTHVCRYWGESIVSAPENWALISSSCDEDMIALCLERAKEAPLEIWLTMYSIMRHPRIPGILMPHFQNVVTLAICYIPTLREFTKLFPSFPRSLSNLRSLTMKMDDVVDWDLSIDPFESLPRTLTYLELAKIPLYPSFLRLRTLTGLSLSDHQFNLHLDTLLNFLEANASLENVVLSIKFVKSSLRNSRRRATMRNRVLRLTLYSLDLVDTRALITNIPLRKGAHLNLFSIDGTGSNVILSGISFTHFPNLSSPTFMEYQSAMRFVRLHGPNGTFSFHRLSSLAEPFADFVGSPLITFTKVREFRITIFDYIVFPLPYLPALETLTIQTHMDVSDILSAFLSNPLSSPSLRTIAFLNCDLSEDFMKELSRFASNRKNASTSAWLHRVLIVHWKGQFPSASSIQRLRSHVRIVDVRLCDNESPTDSDIERYLAG